MILNRLPLGAGEIIKDATATPGDVRLGSVFYNNDGKQFGSFTDFLIPKTGLLKNNTEIRNIKCHSRIGYKLESEKNYLTIIADMFIEHEVTLSGTGTSLYTPVHYVITAITYKGTKYKCFIPCCNQGTTNLVFYNNGTFNFSLTMAYQVLNIIYKSSSEQSQVTITYSEV